MTTVSDGGALCSAPATGASVTTDVNDRWRSTGIVVMIAFSAEPRPASLNGEYRTGRVRTSRNPESLATVRRSVKLMNVLGSAPSRTPSRHASRYSHAKYGLYSTAMTRAVRPRLGLIAVSSP